MAKAHAIFAVLLFLPAIAFAGDASVRTVASIYDNAPRLKDIRARIVADEPVTITELQILADVGDGLAAYKLAERLLAMNRPDLNAKVAHYLAIALNDGRTYAVPPLFDILSDRTSAISPVRLAHIENALARQAAAGDAASVLALARLYLQGYPFGAKPEKARALLRSVADQQSIDGAIALQMAMLIASGGPLTAEDEAAVRAYLEMARQSPELGTRTAAENLLRAFAEPEAISGEDEHG
ncbi:hypothetical protein K7H91_24245 [Martelella mediterranea]|uniref:hypothetical protein n=1 Tax=Martelella mediterranea TaxID=293089 RepID=UPI001E6183F4|nr:hypothetical protein [Martelella mediterranea]MCD1636869.1 hypothetical protein [Martelella mediterranea]